MAVSESNMAEFKIADIIKLSQNEQVKFFLCKMAEYKMAEFQDGLPSISWVRMNDFEADWISLGQSFVQNGWIQDCQIQDGCHHQDESEWMSEVLFVQMAESKMAEFKMAAIIKLSQKWMSEVFLYKMAELRMAD